MTDQAPGSGESTAASARPAVGRQGDLPHLKRPRAARLVEQILGIGTITAAELAAAIVVEEVALVEYRLGRAPMPLDRQLCLALVAIEHVPAARRAGFALRAQVEAELAVAATLTETHDHPPVSHRWP